MHTVSVKQCLTKYGIGLIARAQGVLSDAPIFPRVICCLGCSNVWVRQCLFGGCVPSMTLLPSFPSSVTQFDSSIVHPVECGHIAHTAFRLPPMPAFRPAHSSIFLHTVAATGQSQHGCTRPEDAFIPHCRPGGRLHDICKLEVHASR